MRTINIYQSFDNFISEFNPNVIITSMLKDLNIEDCIYPCYISQTDMYNEKLNDYYTKHYKEILVKNPELDTFEKFKINTYWIKIHGKKIINTSVKEFIERDIDSLFESLYEFRPEQLNLEKISKSNNIINDLDIELYYKFDNNSHNINILEPLINTIADFKLFLKWKNDKYENGNFKHLKSISKISTEELKTNNDIIDYYNFHKIKIPLEEFSTEVKVNNIKTLIIEYMESDIIDYNKLIGNIKLYKSNNSEIQKLNNYFINKNKEITDPILKENFPNKYTDYEIMIINKYIRDANTSTPATINLIKTYLTNSENDIKTILNHSFNNITFRLKTK